MGGGYADRNSKNFLNEGAEQCFTFSTGQSAQYQAAGIHNVLQRYGIGDLQHFMALPDVVQFLEKARLALLAAAPTKATELNESMLGKIESSRFFEIPALAKLAGNDRVVFLNWLVGYDASSKYAKILQNLGITPGASGPGDFVNPNAVAVLVYDEETEKSEFLSNTYSSKGRFSQWTTADAKPIESILKP